MNRALIWSLAGTVALSVWALLNPRTTDSAPAPSAVILPASRNAAVKARVQAPPAAPSPALTGAWPEPAMELGNRSPFGSPPAPPPKPVAPVVVVAPPPPPPPPANYRFWGHLSSPDKQVLTFLAKGQDGAPVEIHTGTRLEDGWAVESISDNAIVLANAATQQHTTVFVPPADPAATH